MIQTVQIMKPVSIGFVRTHAKFLMILVDLMPSVKSTPTEPSVIALLGGQGILTKSAINVRHALL